MPKAYDVEAREREERKRKRRDGEEGREDFDSFPVMMSFKAFLETQDDSITDEEALAKVKKSRFLSFPRYIFIFRRTVVVISSEPRFFKIFQNLMKIKFC